MRRETRPFVVEVRRGQQKKAPQPTILPAPLPELQGDDVMMRRAEEALFGRPAQGPGATTPEPQAPARRILEALAPEVVDIPSAPPVEAPRRGRKPGSKNRPKEQGVETTQVKRGRGRPPKNPDGRVRSVPVTPELATAALEVISRVTTAPIAPVPVTSAPRLPVAQPPKRPRGRPRKVPLTERAPVIAKAAAETHDLPLSLADGMTAARIVARYRDGEARPAGQIWTRRLRSYANPEHRRRGRPRG